MKLLEFVDDMAGEYVLVDKKTVDRHAKGIFKPIYLDDYFPSQIRQTTDRLERKGWVEKEQTREGVKIIITEKGRKEILRYELEKFVPKSEKWDGKWRVVFFDVAEIDRKKRNKLRVVLKNLGLVEFQESVYVGPFDCEKEIKYTREVLDIPHGVKLGILEKIENDDDLRKIFKI